MSIYRRTIVTLDDAQAGIDYMLFCVLEKLWPDMVSPTPLHQHPIGKDFNGDGRYNIGVHIDEVDIAANVLDDPMPHVHLTGKVEMLWGDMRRDPDPGVQGFLLKKGHYDIDSVAEMLPESQSVIQTWAWFDMQRKMYNYLGAQNISLNRIGSFTQKYLNINLADNPLHIGCIYVVHYSSIKTVHVETVPIIPAVRCEIDWRSGAKREDVFVKVKEHDTDKQSIPNEFTQQVKCGVNFALVQMNSRPRKIDIDIVNGAGELLFFLRDVAFLGSVVKPVSKLPSKMQKTMAVPVHAIGLEHYLKPAILEKEAKIKRARMEFVFFDGDPNKKAENKQAAKEYVDRILRLAKKEILIADPYLSADQFNEYIAPLAVEQGLDITIVNCKEQLQEVAHGQGKIFADVENELKTVSAGFNANTNDSKVSVYCVTGQGRLHDRFILSESEGWQIGSSLSEFGNRACTIIKLNESAHMELWQLLKEWCANGTVSYKMK